MWAVATSYHDEMLQEAEILFDVPDLEPGEAEPKAPPGSPSDLKIRWSAPMPILADRADLDIPLPSDAVTRGGDLRHRLVTIGDSLTHGFKSGAISDTWLSWPMIVAYEMGLRAAFRPGEVEKDPEFTYPTFPGPATAPGLPLNLEWMLRQVELAVGGETLHLNEVDLAGAVEHVLRQVAQYWERGEGSAELPAATSFHHNVAVWGFDVRDALSKSTSWVTAAMHPQNLSTSFLKELKTRILQDVQNEFVVSYAQHRSVIRTLHGPDEDATQISAAEWFGANGGIETLVVALGANNALGSVLSLKLNWSKDDYRDLRTKDAYNVWTPAHFEAELDELAARVQGIDAKHVIWATVPHVTVVPLVRGVGKKPYYSRYYTRYTRPWISDSDFDASSDPCLTADEARAIDAAIDQYNYAIKRKVREARSAEGGQAKDWYLLDLCGLLDRLAYERYLSSPQSQPGWFAPYELPPALAALSPRPDTRFFKTDVKGRTQGGIFALDGVHPTTIGYGIIAQEVVQIMSEKAKVPFRGRDGSPRTGEVKVDFDRLVSLDTLIDDPPKLLTQELHLLYEVTKFFDFCQAIVNKL